MSKIIVADKRTGSGTILETWRAYQTQRERAAAMGQLRRMNLVVDTYEMREPDYKYGLHGYLPLQGGEG